MKALLYLSIAFLSTVFFLQATPALANTSDYINNSHTEIFPTGTNLHIDITGFTNSYLVFKDVGVADEDTYQFGGGLSATMDWNTFYHPAPDPANNNYAFVFLNGAQNNWVYFCASSDGTNFLAVPCSQGVDFSFTRFYDLNLANGTTTSTSSPLTFSGYLNLRDNDAPDVFTNNYDIEISVKRNEDDQLVGACSAIGACAPVFSIKAPLLNSGLNVFSTSTDFIPTRGGEYTVEWKLIKKDWASSLISFFALDSLFNTGVVTSTTTTFIAGQLTNYDITIHTIGNAIDQGFASSTSSTTLQKLDHCNPLSGFDTTTCLAGLFTVDPSQGAYLIEKARTDIFSKAPFGYIMRLRDIMATTSTSSLPVLGFTIKAGEPLAGVYAIDMNSVLDQADGLVRNTFKSDQGMVDVPAGKNVWDILMPLVQLVTYLGLFIYIIHDILGMQEFHPPRGRQRNEMQQ